MVAIFWDAKFTNFQGEGVLNRIREPHFPSKHCRKPLKGGAGKLSSRALRQKFANLAVFVLVLSEQLLRKSSVVMSACLEDILGEELFVQRGRRLSEEAHPVTQCMKSCNNFFNFGRQ